MSDTWTEQDEDQRQVDLGDAHASEQDEADRRAYLNLSEYERASEQSFRMGWITQSARTTTEILDRVLDRLAEADDGSYEHRRNVREITKARDRLTSDIEKVTSKAPIYMKDAELERSRKIMPSCR